MRPVMIVAVIVLMVGCGPRDPLRQKVDAASTAQFLRWRAIGAEGMTPALRREIDGAIQELKFAKMSEGVTSTADLDRAMANAVNGKTVAEVLLLGYATQAGRLDQEWVGLNAYLQQNEDLRGSDAASEQSLQQRREKQIARLGSLSNEIRQLRERLTALGLRLPVWTPRELPSLTVRRDAGRTPSGGKVLEVEEHPDSGPSLLRKN